MNIPDFAEKKLKRNLQNILSVCVLVCTCIGVLTHAYKQFYLRVCIHTSECACVYRSARLYLYPFLINLIGLKGPLSPSTVASDHNSHSLVLEFVKLHSHQCNAFYI